MITEQDLHEAIAECQGQRNPNASTCIKLAAYMIILDHLKEDEEVPKHVAYSYAPAPSTVSFDSDSDFAQAVKEMDINDVLMVMDELMATVKVLNPRLYAGVMRKLTF